MSLKLGIRSGDYYCARHNILGLLEIYFNEDTLTTSWLFYFFKMVAILLRKSHIPEYDCISSAAQHNMINLAYKMVMYIETKYCLTFKYVFGIRYAN